MNSELANPEISTTTSPRPRARRLVAVLAVAVVALSACNSDPGRKRVVEDIIQTAVFRGDLTQEQGDCMFEKVEGYSEDELAAISDSAEDAGPGTGIELFEADLASCK